MSSSRMKTPADKLARVKAYQRANPDKVNARVRAHRAANPERYLNNYLRRTYGITLPMYHQMVANQGGRCAICETTEPQAVRWHVDHCHATGKVRGLLCSPCNTSLGGFRDSIPTLKKAILYLEKHHA